MQCHRTENDLYGAVAVGRRALKVPGERLPGLEGVKKVIPNCVCIVLLLRAAKLVAFNKDSDDVKKAFDEAFKDASLSGFLHYSALSSEVAGLYFLERQDAYWSEHYLSDAFERYKAWGTIQKPRAMEESHHFLLLGTRSSTSNRSSMVLGLSRHTSAFCMTG